jgi:hypothetical protein
MPRLVHDVPQLTLIPAVFQMEGGHDHAHHSKKCKLPIYLIAHAGVVDVVSPETRHLHKQVNELFKEGRVSIVKSMMVRKENNLSAISHTASAKSPHALYLTTAIRLQSLSEGTRHASGRRYKIRMSA